MFILEREREGPSCKTSTSAFFGYIYVDKTYVDAYITYTLQTHIPHQGMQ